MPFLLAAQSANDIRIRRAYVDGGRRVVIELRDETTRVVQAERTASPVDGVEVSDNRRAVGWLEFFPNPEDGGAFAGKLPVWRGGQILRPFPTEQVFWSWAFEPGGRRDKLLVAFHTGPAHGERASHCELRDVITGRVMATWDGDLESSTRPEWAAVRAVEPAADRPADRSRVQRVAVAE